LTAQQEIFLPTHALSAIFKIFFEIKDRGGGVTLNLNEKPLILPESGTLHYPHLGPLKTITNDTYKINFSLYHLHLPLPSFPP